jgi:sigma-54 dependent transcriptional regulator, flagellar regulatory protein
MNCLARNRWPGNVRELANLLERLAILFPAQTITAADLPDRYRSAPTVGWLGSEMSIDARPESYNVAEVPSVLAEADADADAAAAVALHDPPVVAYEMLDADALPLGGIDLKDHMSAIEIGLIRRALEEADGTVAGAARLLRIRRTTLVEKLRKYRLSA